ncbi:GtrA family protein [Streptosporangium sp. NPDC004379]|uniref:GtrA family protein n=1 Tax=Streptosporangium sp. NPDC004379 TaxID=3366189 RepID=UPI00369C44C4
MVETASQQARDGTARPGRRAPIPALGGRRAGYLAAGAMTAVIYHVLLGLELLATDGAVPYVVLLMTGHLATSLIVYPWYRLVVFRASGSSWVIGYLRFYAVGLGFLAASVVGVPLLVELAGAPVLVAQGLILIASPPLGYVVHRTWTFSGGGEARPWKRIPCSSTERRASSSRLPEPHGHPDGRTVLRPGIPHGRTQGS